MSKASKEQGCLTALFFEEGTPGAWDITTNDMINAQSIEDRLRLSLATNKTIEHP